MTLSVDIIKDRSKRFYNDILDDLENAKTAYQEQDKDLANLYIQQAQVKSNILIAERLDVLCIILTKDE